MVVEVVTIPPQTLLPEAERLMTHHSIKYLPVVAEGVFTGLLTRSNLLRMKPPSIANNYTKELAALFASTQVKDIMIKAPNIVTVTPEMTIANALSLSLSHNVSILPVVHKKNRQQLIGMVTSTDLIDVLARLFNPSNHVSQFRILNCPRGPRQTDLINIIHSYNANILTFTRFINPVWDSEEILIQLDKYNIYNLIQELKDKKYNITNVVYEADRLKTPVPQAALKK
jgi:CBS domain-containing protein